MKNIEVSIVVISYNSEETILDTLKSIENQTYRNFEVIISDDYSSDKTLEKVYTWKKSVEKKIKNIKIIEASKNRGVTYNINKGLKLVKGKWIKIIAGDDILLDNCLEDNINFINLNNEIRILFSKLELFGNEINKKKIIPRNIKYFHLEPKKQYNKLKIENFIPAPSSFIKKDIFDEYGFFDERIPMIEDWPFWLKLTYNNEKMYLLDKTTVKYRIGESLSKLKKTILNEKAFSSKKLVYKYYLKDNCNFLLRWHYFLEFFILEFIFKLLKNRRSKLSDILVKVGKIIDPVFYLTYIERKLYEK